jgi:hypothetical protein
MIKLLEKIKKSFDLLKLEDDWDDDGAAKPNLKAFNNAMIFLHLLGSKIENVCVPDINPTRNGSIDIQFRNGRHRLLVNIDSNGASCYGDDGNNNDVIKSPDVLFDNIYEWCKKYMVNTID